MRLAFFFQFILITNFGLAQEVIKLDSLSDWKCEYSCDISNDGQFLLINEKIGEKNTYSSIIATRSNWQRKYSNASDFAFTTDCKWILFKKNPDTLSILRLGTDECQDIPFVVSFKIKTVNKTVWIAYKLTTGSVIVQNLKGTTKRQYDSVLDYYFFPGTANLLLESEKRLADSTVFSLEMLNLENNLLTHIWRSVIDSKRYDLKFKFSFAVNMVKTSFLVNLVDIINNSYSSSLWHYDSSLNKAELIMDDGDFDGDLTIGNGPPKFSKNSQIIYVRLQKKAVQNKLPDSSLQIWKYSDYRLPVATPNYFSAINISVGFNLKTRKIIRISEANEVVYFPSNSISDYVLIRNCKGDENESNWNVKGESSFFLVSSFDGSRKLIKERLTSEAEFIGMSPTARWLIYYDIGQHNYFSYEVSTGLVRNISKSINKTWINEDSDITSIVLTWNPSGGSWTENDEEVFISDNYDIWLVDPACRRAPINITNGYGFKNRIKFEFIDNASTYDISKKNSHIILSAFNKTTKENGFFEVDIDKRGNPKQLTMGPYLYYSNTSSISSMKPVKAKFDNSFVVQRMSVGEAPNLFFTRDFIMYKSLSNFRPTVGYNWMTSELVRYKTGNGTYSEGVLYKPANFDSTKKYPLVLHFYERMSNRLNEFIIPVLSDGPLNIPLFVNRGYLVFTPDIYYTIGEPGNSVVNSVVSAAAYLKRFNWIDSTRIGVQGHSWGGYEVNYLITQTKLFAAAAEAAGPSDFISDYGLISHHGRSRTWVYELNQSRMGSSLWDKADLYIKNSPIFKVNDVFTPVLIMHNEKDDQVPWTQGLEWFMGLRRANKKVWMLNYKNEGHSLTQDKNAFDYTVRLLEFFDYYLKGLPCPSWMR